MSNQIHPTAIVDPKASLGDHNFIGPYCIIGPNVVIGSENRFESHVTIGTAAQHRDYFRLPPGPVHIGNENIFREFVTVNGGTRAVTTVGNKNTLLICSHVGHDCLIKDSCNLGNNTVLGGHSIIGTGANLGLSTVVHQYRVIGAFAMIGMNSTVTRDLIPFTIAFGSPCEPHRVNRIGLQRAGLKAEELHYFEEWFTNFRLKSDGVPVLQHAFQQYIHEFEKDRRYWNEIQAAA